METKTYRIEGLACSDCAGRIQAEVSRMPGVRECRVDINTGNLTLRLDAPTFDDAPVARAVAATGHRLLAPRERGSAATSASGNSIVVFVRFLFAQRATAMTAIAGGLTLLGLLLLALPLPVFVPQVVPQLAPQVALGLAILIGGLPVARNAFQELARAHTLGINALMVIAVTGALFIGEWAEAAIVVTLFALGEALESYAAERARGALESLLDLAPPTALRLLPDGSAAETPVEQLVVGDRVRIRPGDRVSVDGVVRAGQSAVDQAAITGESIPVDKESGDPVYAGTVNSFGALEVEVTRLAADNTLNRMITLVQEAQSRQAPVQRFVERFARVYTPAVTLAAALVASVPPLAFGQPFWGEQGGLLRALEMLVIACPCALVISTPVSVVSALTHAAQRGVLIKGGRTLELLGRVKVFAFDKTGTLTEGRPVTTDVLDVCAAECNNGLAYAAAVEAQSAHPLARAMVAAAHARQIAPLPAQEVAHLNGRGVTGLVNGARVTVASHPYCDATIPHSEAVCREAERLSADGKTVMLVCHDEQVCSVVAMADTPRPASRRALDELRRMGELRTIMLTGDSAAVAHAIAAQVGVDDVRAGLLPEDKVTAVRDLQGGAATANAVAFVGDGVNDAPALAQANVGIAMGGAASAQAMESADVVLMGEDLRQLPFLVQLSRRTQRIIRANIFLALGIKALVFGLALAGMASLWLAIVADVGASLTVILNGMRLRQA